MGVASAVVMVYQGEVVTSPELAVSWICHWISPAGKVPAGMVTELSSNAATVWIWPEEPSRQRKKPLSCTTGVMQEPFGRASQAKTAGCARSTKPEVGAQERMERPTVAVSSTTSLSAGLRAVVAEAEAISALMPDLKSLTKIKKLWTILSAS